MFLTKLTVYAIYLAVAVAFGLMRYTSVGCRVVARYSAERSHNWARLVAIIMLVAVELMHWHSVRQLFVRWKMEEDAIFFAVIFLAFATYGLHRIFCWLVQAFEPISYARARADARYFSSECSKCCHRASDRITELECPVMEVTHCPCLDDGYDVREIDYTSEVFAAIRERAATYHRHGLETPRPIIIDVPKRRVVVKSNPYDALFETPRWSFDVELDDYSWLKRPEAAQSAQSAQSIQPAEVVDFPSTLVTSATQPSTPEPLILQVRLVRGRYGAFQLRMTSDGLVCRLARQLSDDNVFEQEIHFPRLEDSRKLDEFLTSAQGELLVHFINAPAFDQKVINQLS